MCSYPTADAGQSIGVGFPTCAGVEFYFINLRARSVGEVVQNRYRCENEVEEKVCGNLMDVELNVYLCCLL